MPTTALLVIDAQRIYTEKDAALHCKDAANTIRRINQLIEAFQAKKGPIIYVRHQHKKDGSDTGRLFDYEGEDEGEDEFNFVEGTDEVEFSPELIVADKRHEIIKNRYSAFKNTTLHKLLAKLDANRLVICGFMTNFCCESTAREALDLDFYVDFIVDATGTPGTDSLTQDRIRIVVAQLLEAGFSRVFKTEDYLSSEA